MEGHEPPAATPPPSKRQRLANELSSRVESGVDDSDVSQEFTCTICQDIFDDPVILKATGQTYCRACVSEHLKHRPTCPNTGEQVTIERGNPDRALLPNHSVRNIMGAHKVPCRFSECAQRVKFGDIDAHERACEYAPQPCSGGVHGCTFHGRREEVTAHEAECAFVKLEPTLRALKAQIESRNEQIKDRDKQIEDRDEQIKDRGEQIEDRDEQIKDRDEQIEDRDEVIKEGDEHIKDRDEQIESRDNQIEVLDEKIEAHATAVETIVEQAEAFKNEEKWAEAAVAYRAAVTADPSNDSAWFTLGIAFNYINDFVHCEAEVEPYTRAVELNPTCALSNTALANVLWKVRRDIDEAERLMRKAIALDPEYEDGHWDLSTLLEQERSDLDGAIAEMREYIRCGDSDSKGEPQLAKLIARRARA